MATTGKQTQIQHRTLGNSSIDVAPLAFGGNVFGWTVDEQTSFSLLDKFIDAGLNLVDTADVYSRWANGNKGGESETIIGKWIKAGGRRDKLVIATKVGMDMGDGKIGLSPDYIKRAVEDSLTRLQTDYIALYQSLQPEYNLYSRADFENNLEQYCLKEKIGVINYYSLASGFLSGKYRSEKDLGKSTRGGKTQSYLNPRGLRILDALDAVAERYSSTPASVALAWLIARPSITAPIASATTLAQMDALIEATQLSLDGAAIAQLDQASAP